jgi:two-component system, chemotaxis family, protein-glutamate methylesterase/glutaminase
LTSEFTPQKQSAGKSANQIPLKRLAAIKVVVLGASTGGPDVIRQIVRALPAEFSYPILMVQHIAPGFIEGMAAWMVKETPLEVCLASHGEHIRSGVIYLAPEGVHMGLAKKYVVELSEHPPEYRVRPAVAHLFRTTARIAGKTAVGILLTGMGRDGAKELRELRDAGAITIAQNEATSIVFGMPGEAVKLDACDYVLSIQEIIEFLKDLAAHKQL